MGKRKVRNPDRKPMTPEQTGGDAAREAARPQGRMEPQLQDHIGQQLRALYNEVLEEPIPDRFLKLLADLESKEGGKQ